MSKMIQISKGIVSLPEYMQAWEKVKHNPEAIFKHGVNGWWSQKGKDIYKDFLDALHDRINIRGGIQFKGRKFSEHFQSKLLLAKNPHYHKLIAKELINQ